MNVDYGAMRKFVTDSGLVSAADFDAAEKEAIAKSQKVGDVLVAQGKMTDDDYRRVLAYITAIPFIDLQEQKIDFDILSMIPEPIARKHNIIAFKKKGDALEVAMLDVDDLSAIDFIKKKTGLRILPRLSNPSSIKSVLLQYQKSLKADFGDIIQQESSNLKTIDMGNGEEASGEDLKKMADDLPTVRIVETLLKHAAIQGASDIHIEQTEFEVIVRYRIDGMLHDAMILPKVVGPSITARIKVLSNLKLDEKRLPQDGRFRIDLNGEKISFRVSVLPTYYGEKTVMRLLRESVSGFTLESLGFHGRDLEVLHAGVQSSEGLFLTTGPTGSGKTTTLYTVLDILNTADVNISTVEDPVEYQIKRINQTQVKPEIGFTFASGLRSLLRQDPDIIMVGEIRDNETASLAINAALTGHFVLSTLHTNSAAGAIPRLMDMKCEPFLLVSTLKVIIAQRLVRKLHSNSEKYNLTDAEIERINKYMDMDRVLAALKAEKVVDSKATWKTIDFYKPKADKETEDGYKGRVGIHEVLVMSQTIRDLIISGGTSDAIEVQARKEGMLTMAEDGLFKAAQGQTTIEEILRVVSE